MSGLTDDERRELQESAAAEAKRLADAQSGLPCARCADRPNSDRGRFEPHERGLLAPLIKSKGCYAWRTPWIRNLLPYSWHTTIDDTMRFRETPAKSRCVESSWQTSRDFGEMLRISFSVKRDAYRWRATYSHGAPLPPGDTRPPVLGGECARCFARPPYHERWCMTRRDCTR